MVDYQNGKIYIITSPNLPCKCYVGSTTKGLLSKRLSEHKADYKLYLEGKRYYVSSFEILQAGNTEIFLHEKFPCNSKDELRAREQYWKNKIELDCVNKIRALRTKDQELEYRRERYQNNREKFLESARKYQIENKEKCKEFAKKYYEKNVEKKQQYYKENKEKILETRREYYQENKEKINARRKELNKLKKED